MVVEGVVDWLSVVVGGDGKDGGEDNDVEKVFEGNLHCDKIAVISCEMTSGFDQG